MSIAKPGGFDLDKFKSKRAAGDGERRDPANGAPGSSHFGGQRLRPAAPRRRRLLVDELCFVNVPIKGQKRDTLHLIDEDLAMRIPAVGTRPALPLGAGDEAVRRVLPVQRADAEHRQLLECQQPAWPASRPKTRGRRLTSRKDEGVEGYKIDFARDQDAFPKPKWPTQSLDELIEVTFAGRMIDHERSPRPAAPDRREAVRVVSENFGTIVVCDFEYEVADGDLPNVALHGGVRAG